MKITLVRHSTLLVETAQFTLLVDPYFSKAAFPWRSKPLTVDPHELPPLDLLVCTHSHFDHFELNPILGLQPDLRLLVRPQDEPFAREQGAKLIHALPLWETYQQGAVTITALPSEHPYGGSFAYILQAENQTLYLAGDTLYHDQMKEIARRFPSIDAAFMSVEGMKANGKLTTMNNQQALQATQLLKPRHLVPIHLGLGSWLPFLFGASNTPKSFQKRLKKSGIPTEFHHLQAGESLTL